MIRNNFLRILNITKKNNFLFSEQSKTGKFLFQTLYFPLQRLQFPTEFQQIYEQDEEKYNKIQGRMKKMKTLFFLPFGLYFTNFLLFCNLTNPLHYLAQIALLGLGTRQYIGSAYINSMTAQKFYINDEATKFKVQIPASTYAFISLGQEYDPTQKFIEFDFKMEEIHDITMMNQLKDEFQPINEEKKEKQNKSEKEALGIIEPDDLEDQVYIEVKRPDSNNIIKFTVDIGMNKMKNFNDYLIALGKRHRLVIRNSNKKEEQVKDQSNDENDLKQ